MPDSAPEVKQEEPRCPNCRLSLSLDDSGVPVYECHDCRMTWPVSYFDDSSVGADVERVELNRLAGKMLGALDYLREVATLRRMEGAVFAGLANRLADLADARERIIAIAADLPEGRLEAFAREHPMYVDQIDGPYCGYGAKEGRPHSCPVHNAALHWDAWEVMGTREKRPARAVRPKHVDAPKVAG